MKQLWLLLLCALLLALPTAGVAQEQAPPRRAGLLIQAGDGSVQRYCVRFAEEQITGLELLERAGVNYVAQSSGLGTAICKIDNLGCDYPAQDCFCQCRGAECRYWAYQTLVEGAWRYSQLGAHARRLSDGDVDGWAWGSGSVSEGAAPPVLSIDEICPPVLEPTAVLAVPAPATLVATTGAALTLPTPSAAADTTVGRLPSATSQPTPVATAVPTMAETLLALVAPTLPPVTAATPPAASAPAAQAAPGQYLWFAAVLLVLLAGIAVALRRRSG